MKRLLFHQYLHVETLLAGEYTKSNGTITSNCLSGQGASRSIKIKAGLNLLPNFVYPIARCSTMTHAQGLQLFQQLIGAKYPK